MLTIISNPDSFNTPILFMLYNRPDLASITFEEIKKIKPTKLYIAVDGPKNESEYVFVKQCQNIHQNIDWPCEIHTLFREKNLGCKVAVREAINWFFDNEEMGIILEDDCLPNNSFFHFCDSMLKYYKDDLNIGHISGTNFLNQNNCVESYYFSNYTYVWGWATWRRAWKLYDSDISDINSFLNKEYKVQKTLTFKENIYWTERFLKTYFNKIDTWDYQWLYCNWKNNLKAIVPTRNMISNIGFDNRATHTFRLIERLANKKTDTLNLIIHPQSNAINSKNDLNSYNYIFNLNIITSFYICYKKMIFVFLSKLKLYLLQHKKPYKQHWALRIFF